MNRMKQIIGKQRGFFLENITRWLIFGLLVGPTNPIWCLAFYGMTI
jgi:hypothetical protein